MHNGYAGMGLVSASGSRSKYDIGTNDSGRRCPPTDDAAPPGGASLCTHSNVSASSCPSFTILSTSSRDSKRMSLAEAIPLYSMLPPCMTPPRRAGRRPCVHSILPIQRLLIYQMTCPVHTPRHPFKGCTLSDDTTAPEGVASGAG